MSDKELYWVILREPKRVPQRKGPFDYAWCLRFVREVIDNRPTAYIIVLTPDGTGSAWPEDGGDWLWQQDRRSSPKTRRYFAATAEAHGDHSALSEPDCAHCNGTGWVDDQNWSPRYDDIPQEREPWDGQIQCGICLGDGIALPPYCPTGSIPIRRADIELCIQHFADHQKPVWQDLSERLQSALKGGAA